MPAACGQGERTDIFPRKKRRFQRHSTLDAASAQEDAKCAWATARRVAYQEALALWNELDKSTRDRIAVPGSQSARLWP